uniref:Uncharacterized protein n=1 Tax=Anguilla anguilla TaxID=7936 RepID=A0A0E9X049_ANGAN
MLCFLLQRQKKSTSCCWFLMCINNTLNFDTGTSLSSTHNGDWRQNEKHTLWYIELVQYPILTRLPAMILLCS